MAGAVTVKMEGFAEFDRQLRQLPGKVARKVGRTVMKRSARPVRKKMRDEITANVQGPYSIGALRKSIGIKVKFYRPDTMVAIVGPRSKFRMRGRRPALYAHLLERGFTQKRVTVGRGVVVPAYPPIRHEGKNFLEKSWSAASREALERIKAEYAVEIPKAAMEARHG
jgi:hypothetical protein